MKKTATIQMRLHPNTARKIKDFARINKRTITGVLLAGVMNYIKNQEEKPTQNLEKALTKSLKGLR